MFTNINVGLIDIEEIEGVLAEVREDGKCYYTAIGKSGHQYDCGTEEPQGERIDLRDKFAMAALAGDLGQGALNDVGQLISPEAIAKRAYAIADAMLSAR